jgi:hypothetical protein
LKIGGDDKARENILRRFTNWSLRYKLLVVLLQLGITTFAVTGAISYIKHLRSLKKDVVNQLTSIRRAKAYQIESYYRTIITLRLSARIGCSSMR